jgi:hypothetical protein
MSTAATSERPYLVSVAYQHPRYTVGGESKKDHGALQAEYEKGSTGRTLCGRPLGRWYFPRLERFSGAWSFHCAQCVAVAVKAGYLDPASLDKHFRQAVSA